MVMGENLEHRYEKGFSEHATVDAQIEHGILKEKISSPILFRMWNKCLYIGLLLVSAIIGIYSAFRGRKNETTENYYFGNRKMSPIPLGCSMAVSFISAITMLGTPTEVYLFGAVFAWGCVGKIITIVFTCTYFVPLVCKLKLTSVYEYLELRFDRKVRIFCSSVSVLMMVFYMGFCIYIPALALNAVTPLDIKWTIILISSVCTFYTTLGGIKAVIWTDVLQSVIMFIGSTALLIQGTKLVGGPTEVWEAIHRGGRMNIFKITADPTIRSSMIAVLIGSIALEGASTCSNQAMVQRILSSGSVKNARRALIFFLLPSTVITLLAIANGCVLYAYFENCDPLQSKQVTRTDQYIAYMMMKAFRDFPGMAGVFVAAACSGTLSTVSTGINSLSVVILHDLVFPFKDSFSPKKKLWTGKLCGVILGCLVTLIAYITGYLGSTVIQVAISTVGAFGGPIFGIFIAGMFLPKTNAKGALFGVILGSALSVWLVVGAAIYGIRPEKAQILPISTSNCSVIYSDEFTTPVITTFNLTTTSGKNAVNDRPAIADTFYSTSFFYFGMIGTLGSIIFTVLASAITGGDDARKLDPSLFVPLLDNKIFPSKIRKIFRCGVPEIRDDWNMEEVSDFIQTKTVIHQGGKF